MPRNSGNTKLVVAGSRSPSVTRADIAGFCLPFAEELLKLSEANGLPVKIRLCDTMGYGLPYPGVALPRSIRKMAYYLQRELGIPSANLEWHERYLVIAHHLIGRF